MLFRSPSTEAFSITAVFKPCTDAVTAALMAAAPDPTTIRSYRLFSSRGIVGDGVAGGGIEAWLEGIHATWRRGHSDPRGPAGAAHHAKKWNCAACGVPLALLPGVCELAVTCTVTNAVVSVIPGV